MEKKRVLITGITGMDASYLAEFLLEKGYEIYGLARRSSCQNHWRIKNIKDKICFIYGDMTDQGSLDRAVTLSRPDEIYNLAAQSFVGSSWQHPEQTMEVNALGCLRILESVRKIKPDCKFYQASSSEQFGRVRETPQNEKTPFYARSPYGISKVAAFDFVRNYRESYGIFACNGILFNHECLTAQTPIIIKSGGVIDILPIEEIVPHREDYTKGKIYTTIEKGDLQVWDGGSWTKVKKKTATWNDYSKEDKEIYQVICRGGYYEATGEHISFLEGGKEVITREIKKGDRLEIKELPPHNDCLILSEEEAEFMGMMVADGYISKKWSGRFAKNEDSLRNRVKELWFKLTGGYVREGESPSGFKKGNFVKKIELSGGSSYLRFLHKQIYTEKGFKRVPKRILNSNKKIMYSFLKGYNICDGLKGGKQKSEFKSFTTNSPTLAQGLWYLIYCAFGLRITLHPEFRSGNIYYHLNINSPKKNNTGKHLVKKINEIKKTKEINYCGWVFDLETDSSTFSAGIGLTWVHNSPCRGIEFVTRKISDGVAKIKMGLSKEIRLGNISTKRDWGNSKEYIEAMYLMLQQDTPDDYVIATGETHSVQEFVEEAFKVAGIENWQEYVKQDEQFMRPAEVDLLLGDASKAREKLGWEPKTTFKELVKEMVEADLDRLKKGLVEY